jgi:hypothetical protein
MDAGFNNILEFYDSPTSLFTETTSGVPPLLEIFLT